MFIKRVIQTELLESARHFYALAVLGPRQSGKTTVVKNTFTNYAYVNLEHPGMREFAQRDPEGFFLQYRNEHGLIIDEFQHVPELLSYIQIFIDEEKKKGYFILTGSQNFLMNEKISQTLAGRIAIHTLLPLSIQELKKASLLPDTPEQLIWKGCYPSVYADQALVEQWYASYIQTYLERDVRQIKQVENLDTFKNFVRLCAGRVGQVLNLTSLGNDCGVSDATASRWISLLEASYLIVLLRPYHTNFNKRIIKSPKLYFVDTGLACSLLNIQHDQINEHYLRGGLFENMIIVEFFKQFYNQGKLPHLYFWRDQAGHEVDLLVDKGTFTYPVEIKASRTISQAFFANVDYWSALAGTQKKQSVIVYAGDEQQRRSAGHVISWKYVDDVMER